MVREAIEVDGKKNGNLVGPEEKCAGAAADRDLSVS